MLRTQKRGRAGEEEEEEEVEVEVEVERDADDDDDDDFDADDEEEAKAPPFPRQAAPIPPRLFARAESEGCPVALVASLPTDEVEGSDADDEEEKAEKRSSPFRLLEPATKRTTQATSKAETTQAKAFLLLDDGEAEALLAAVDACCWTGSMDAAEGLRRSISSTTNAFFFFDSFFRQF